VGSGAAMASPIGKHESAARCLKYVADRTLLLSGSWDRTLQSWDPRTPGTPNHIVPLPDKVYSMDVSLSTNKVVVAMANRHVHIYDLRKLSSPEQTRSSSLRHQTRCVRCSPEGWGYVLSSIEGRVAVEFFDPSPEAQTKKYAFKCHRKTVDGVETAFPVNTVAFHPVHRTFATGGCDNLVNVWDAGRRKRVCAFRPFPTSVADLDFSSDGRFLAVAASYTWEMGEKE
jgi:cell cycle arrest protein BUB3